MELTDDIIPGNSCLYVSLSFSRNHQLRDRFNRSEAHRYVVSPNFFCTAREKRTVPQDFKMTSKFAKKAPSFDLLDPELPKLLEDHERSLKFPRFTKSIGQSSSAFSLTHSLSPSPHYFSSPSTSILSASILSKSTDVVVRSMGPRQRNPLNLPREVQLQTPRCDHPDQSLPISHSDDAQYHLRLYGR